jgi:hypothetical protein
MNPLGIPPIAEASEDSIELLRLWAVRGAGQQIILRHSAWKDPAAWGLALVDIARHVARAHAQEGKNEEEIFQRIIAGFKMELETSTDTPTGELEP